MKEGWGLGKREGWNGCGRFLAVGLMAGFLGGCAVPQHELEQQEPKLVFLENVEYESYRRCLLAGWAASDAEVEVRTTQSGEQFSVYTPGFPKHHILTLKILDTEPLNTQIWIRPGGEGSPRFKVVEACR